ncbi:MAG TPA: aminotransferase class V-fold PLP-dependent enzyme [Gemmatimonadaceae bacterium]|nr:aminotransferase class V-fold PLP-dependent enzyme [Gemmatimonadaceae bacterium]
MTSRRGFMAWAAAAPFVLRELVASAGDDEGYWATIRRAFDLDPSVIYLNSAGLSPTPTTVFDAMLRDTRYSNTAPVPHLWRELEPRVEGVRRELATEFGCDPEEIAVTRNASEAMEILIAGIPLRAGDEVIVTAQNYDRMLTAWDQRARRDGIVVRTVSFTLPTTDDTILGLIRAAITPRTRVIELAHLTNWTGQPMPVSEVIALARPLGIDVLVDGAQTFAHTPVSRDQLDCDYYGTSLHKWLLAPLGTGFLYVRRSKIDAIWPLMAASSAHRSDIRKFEEIGTHPAAPHNAITLALAFHRAIGGTRKLGRVRMLRDRWVKALTEDPRVHVRTPINDPRSGAIALVEIEGLDTAKLAQWLWSRHHMVTSAISFGGVTGLRVTPNIFTTPAEIDAFTDAVRAALQRGLT